MAKKRIIDNGTKFDLRHCQTTVDGVIVNPGVTVIITETTKKLCAMEHSK